MSAPLSLSAQPFSIQVVMSPLFLHVTSQTLLVGPQLANLYLVTFTKDAVRAYLHTACVMFKQVLHAWQGPARRHS